MTHLQQAVAETLSPEPQASNQTYLPSKHYSTTGSPTPVGPTIDLTRKAPPLDGGTLGSLSGAVDHVGPSFSKNLDAGTPRKTSMVTERSYFVDQLAGSVGNSSKAGLDLNQWTAAADHRAGSGLKRSVTVAPVRLFSKAAIHPYASEGLSCQGPDSAVLSSAGGTPYCLGIRGLTSDDGAPVWPP
jgi:hypothetical protein